jgi:hypothetical protein
MDTRVRQQMLPITQSNMVLFCNPSLWITGTINPCDLHDPVIQILEGEQIDLDQASQVILPDKE